MRRKALEKGAELLRKQPDLSTKTVYSWSEKGTGPNFVMLCELMQGGDRMETIPITVILFIFLILKKKTEGLTDLKKIFFFFLNFFWCVCV